jgi:hypothetical protein
MEALMKRTTLITLLVTFGSSLACQLLAPVRPGTVISACAQIVAEIAHLQAGDLPRQLFETGVKQGDEFDVHQYFDVLSHISMQDGFDLDYVYQIDSLGGYPLLYAHPVDQTPYASVTDIPENTQLPDFQEYLTVDATEQGYFEYVVMDIMAGQFYLYWHANYNDTQIVCNRQQIYDIVAQVNTGDFGATMDTAQQAKVRTLRNIVPVVVLEGETATVEVVTFTKWGGFYRYTYTVRREFPHTILDLEQENLVPYDCGVMF